MFNLVLILSLSTPSNTMLGYIYDRSKNNQETLFCVVSAGGGWEDTFIYHNNKDNSIKTPIIARYNRQGRGNTILFIYHFLSMNLIGLPGRRLYLQPVKSLLPARYLLDSNGLQQQQSRPGWQTVAGGDLAGWPLPTTVCNQQEETCRATARSAATLPANIPRPVDIVL